MRLDVWLIAALLVGCGGEKEVREASAHNRVKARSGKVWRNDLVQGLQLEAGQVCKELGSFDCVDDAHLITMGGVEPERLGIDKPLAEVPVSAPIAFDRVAISACSQRLELDRQGTPVVFGPVLDADDAESRAEVSRTLVKRLLGREATEAQVEGLVGLYDTVAPLSSSPVDDWSVGACVVVATSVEALFY